MHAQGCRGRGDHGVAFLPFLILQRELLALKWILSPLEASVCVMGSGVWRQRWDPKSKFKLLHRCFLATWSSWRALPLTSVGGTCPLPPTILLPRLLSLAGTFLTLTPVVPSLPSHQAVKDVEALYSQQKQDWELTVAQIMDSLLPNSDLN